MSSRMSADMVSAAGVVCACIAARLMLAHATRLALLAFLCRVLCDSLDGLVARRRLRLTKHASLFHTKGFAVDAAADTIGVAVRLLPRGTATVTDSESGRCSSWPASSPCAADATSNRLLTTCLCT